MGTVPSDTPNVKIGSPPPSPPPPKAEIVPGHVMQNPKPSYPEDAKRMGIAGPVVLSVVISKDGKVKQVHRVSGDPRLARAAEEAVGRWKYSPYTLNGEPIEANTEITINFTVSPK
jgi:TonB family protein